MAITTKEIVKLINNITDTTYDTKIDAQIPIVQELIHDYTNNDFFSKSLEMTETSKGYETIEIANVVSTGTYIIDNVLKTITSTIESFSDFVVGDNIRIVSSVRNDGYYTITAVTDYIITVAEDITVADEYITIVLVIYPKNVSNISALMVGWDVLKRNQTTGLESERIGTYSYKLKEVGGSMYPVDIVNGLKRLHGGK